MSDEHFSLQWDNFHQNMSAGIQSLLGTEDLVDVTLAVEGRQLKAHKMVLSLCSPYFRQLFQSSPCKHPIVFMRDVSYTALIDLLQFMYHGEVQVAQENLPIFVKTAKALQIKGLAEDSRNQNEESIETTKSTNEATKRHTDEVSPPLPTLEKGLASKRVRVSSPSPSSSAAAAVVLTENVIFLKTEPSDNTETSTDKQVADKTRDSFIDETSFEKDNILMETNEDDPKPGTSSDGTGESQRFNLEDSSLLPNITDVEGLNEDNDLFLLLSKYSMESFFTYFKERGITMDCFQWIRERDLKEIFGMNQGARIKFRGVVNDWRTSNGFPVIPNCCERERESNTSIEVSVEDTLRSSSVSEGVSTSTASFSSNIDTILETDIGKKLIKVYEKNKMFKMPEKEALVKNIVKHFIDKNVPMTISTCQDMAIQICNKFENESMEYYFVKKPKTSGRLYNRYRSESSSFKRSGLFTGYIREKRKSRTIVKECQTEDTSIDTTSQIEEKEWLKTKTSPWDAVELKWKQSFNLRRKDVKTTTSINQLFKEWPLFLHSSGSRLIDIDFELLLPGKSNAFFVKWNLIESKLVEACKKFNKFPAASDILESLPKNLDLRRYSLAKVLQAVVKPKGRKKIDNKVWKISIGDAWKSFSSEVRTIADIRTVINKRKQFCIEKKITLQPFLTVVGDREEEVNLQFALVTDKITYLFSNFLQAFDAYFKIFFVLNLQYSFENQEFWQFVQSYFYNIDSDKVVFPNLSDFINFLDN